MNVVRHGIYGDAFALKLAYDSAHAGEQVRLEIARNERLAVFGAEDDVG
jgi:hypothetical protein